MLIGPSKVYEEQSVSTRPQKKTIVSVETVASLSRES